jgi:tetratricopeptide (TPR) repeat protein
MRNNEGVEETPLAIRAVATLQNGNYPEALNLLNEYITRIEGFGKLSSDDGVWYYNRSIAKEALLDKNGAIDDLKKCLIVTKLHQAFYRLAILQSQCGENKESLTNLVNAYELGNTDAEIQLREYTNYFNR